MHIQHSRKTRGCQEVKDKKHARECVMGKNDNQKRGRALTLYEEYVTMCLNDLVIFAPNIVITNR
jgi:hypothetical protein